MGHNEACGALTRGFRQEMFQTLRAKLAWRLDPELVQARKSILPFVRGLRFSALLIYAIRDILKNRDLTANWGAVLTPDGARGSPECDIIIHHERGYEERWDGDDADTGRVMDFRFIRPEHAKAVISCKGMLFSSVDQRIKDYAIELKNHVEELWLFAERCRRRGIPKLRKAALAAGYDRFDCLCAVESSKGTAEEEIWDENSWLDFRQAVERL